MTRAEIVAYFEDYVRRFRLPVRGNITLRPMTVILIRAHADAQVSLIFNLTDGVLDNAPKNALEKLIGRH
jgi:hypothetical protein